MNNPLFNPFKNMSVWKRIVSYFFSGLVALYCIVWILSPYFIRHFLTEHLRENHLVLSPETTIRYNPFIAHLTISDLSLSKEDTPVNTVFSLDTVELEVRLYQFLLDEIFISEFDIKGLFIEVVLEQADIEIAGIRYQLDAEQGQAEVDDSIKNTVAFDSIEAEPEQGNNFPYFLNIPILLLENSIVELLINGAPHQVKFNKLQLSDFGATLTKQALYLAIESEVNQSALSMSVQAQLDNNEGDLLVNVALEKINLNRFKHLLPTDVAQLIGNVSYKASHVISLQNETISIDFNDVIFSLDELFLKHNQTNLAMHKTIIQSKKLALLINKEAELSLYGDASLKSDRIETTGEEKEHLLASLKSLVIPELLFNTDNNLQSVSIPLITLHNAVFSDDLLNDISPLARFSELKMSDLLFTEHVLALNEVSLAGLVVNAELNQQKELLNLLEYKNEAFIDKESEHHDAQVNSDNDINEIDLSLNTFKLKDQAIIDFNDNSVTPQYHRNFTISKFNLGPFKSQQPEMKSLFEIAGKSNKYATINFNGYLQPFLFEPIYHIEGNLKEASLPALSSYIKDALQYEVQSGQLDLGLNVNLTGADIEGDIDVLLRGIELTAANDHETGSLLDQTSVPFNIALGMLKDGDGNVDLSLPISGNIDSPSFGFSGFMTLLIKQATISAAKEYLITTFVPYSSVVNIVIAAGEYALKLRINDLEFPPQLVELQPQHEEFLTQFANLLRDNSDVQVTLCAIATVDDLGKESIDKITDKTAIDNLRDISNARVNAFKAYMVEIEKIASSRLLLCTPQIDSSPKAKPLISFET